MSFALWAQSSNAQSFSVLALGAVALKASALRAADRTRQDSTELNRTRQDSTGLDRFRQDLTELDRTRQDSTGGAVALWRWALKAPTLLSLLRAPQENLVFDHAFGLADSCARGLHFARLAEFCLSVAPALQSSGAPLSTMSTPRDMSEHTCADVQQTYSRRAQTCTIRAQTRSIRAADVQHTCSRRAADVQQTWNTRAADVRTRAADARRCAADVQQMCADVRPACSRGAQSARAFGLVDQAFDLCGSHNRAVT